MTVCFKRLAGVSLLFAAFLLCSCANVTTFGRLSYASAAADPLTNYSLTGDTDPVLDPSVMRQASTYYAFSTDVAGFPSAGNLPIHCSQDRVNWTLCGYVFTQIPAWVQRDVPGIAGLWAPDISYFNGEYHLYYTGSVLNTNESVIGLATNVTLDPGDPNYRWIDRGLVIQSQSGDDFNALDPNIFVDSDGGVWLTYGSYWTGIKQRQIDPSSGMILRSNPTRYELASRPGVPDDAIEGASLVHHGNYYYLFVSVDHCCKATTAEDNYKQAVGRSTSPHGPFVDEFGTPMMQGGGTVLLQGNSTWNAPGGGTAYLDPPSGDSFLIFHAQNLQQGGVPHVWVKNINWDHEWPSFQD